MANMLRITTYVIVLPFKSAKPRISRQTVSVSLLGHRHSRKLLTLKLVDAGFAFSSVHI